MKRDRGTPFSLPIPAGGLAGERSNLTQLAPQAGKVRLICHICFTDFLRPAAWVKRVKTSYCGRSCAAQGARVETETKCKACGKPMIQSPSDADRVKTCSKECSSALKRSRGRGHSVTSWSSYRAAAGEVARRGKCVRCGTCAGPWVVRGLRVVAESGQLPRAVSESAELWCRHCHMVAIQPDGLAARKYRPLHPNVLVSRQGGAT